MRAIASAKVLSEKIGSSLEVAWFLDSHLFAKFSDLFEPIENIKVSNYGLENPILKRIQLLKFFKSRFSSIEFLTKRKYDVIFSQQEMISNALDEDSIYDLSGKRVLLKSYAKFYNSPSLSFTFFQPIMLLEEIINSKARDFDEYTVGVHVRRNDNKKSISHSTDELFFKEIDCRIEKQSDFNFFLATDCPETESLFINRYGARVHVFKKENSCSTPQIIQCSVIDLYLLSRTKEIIGSYWSSFSRTAAEIGNIPIFIVGKG